MVNFCAVCGCCTRTDIVREHLEDTLRICEVSAMGVLAVLLVTTLIEISVYSHTSFLMMTATVSRNVE
jgi:hypothetical protein